MTDLGWGQLSPRDKRVVVATLTLILSGVACIACVFLGNWRYAAGSGMIAYVAFWWIRHD